MGLKVLIVGGGAAGLAIAQGLKKAGIEYEVFEGLPEGKNRPRDWGITIHWGLQYLEQCLPDSMTPRIREMATDPSYNEKDEGYPFCNGRTGEVLKIVQSNSSMRLSRRKIRVVLSEGIDVNYGKKLHTVTTTDSGVTLKFEDGTEATGSMVVGCDGGRSKVRVSLVGPEAAECKDKGLSMINLQQSYTAEQARLLRAIHPTFKAAYLANFMDALAILDVPDENAPETWKYQIATSWKGAPYARDIKDDPKKVMEFYKAHAAELADPWRTALSAVDPRTVLPCDAIQVWSPFPWNNRGGRITLAGDAAHAIPPFRGQALNNAFQDAALIVEQLKTVATGEQDLETAISAYEAEMIPRTSKEVDLSLEQGLLCHDWNTFRQSPYFRGVGMFKVREQPIVTAKEHPIAA